MIYAPLGYIWPKAIVDPWLLLQEYYEAMRAASRTSQYQWQGDAITDINKVVRGQSVKVQTSSQPVTFDETVGSYPDLSADVDAWDVPYNSSFQEIDDTRRVWTSQYPELVLVAFSYQYVRE